MPWEPLTDEQREIRELVRTLARERIAPRAAEIDESHEFPWDVVELFREHEHLRAASSRRSTAAPAPGTLLALVAIEEVSKVCATSGLILAVQELGSLGLKLAGSRGAEGSATCRKLASGEWLAAYALTEAGSGSDSAAMRTTARREGDEYVLDGSKRFITNAGVAQPLHRVREDRSGRRATPGSRPSSSRRTRPGFEVARLEPKMGIAGSTTGELVFDGLPRPGGEPARRGGRGLPDRDADPRPLAARASPRRGSGSRRARPTTRSSTRRRARRWASRSREHQLIAGKLADMETALRGGARPALPLRPDGRRGRRRRRADEGLGDGEALLHRHRDGGRRPRPCRSSAATATSRSTRSSA